MRREFFDPAIDGCVPLSTAPDSSAVKGSLCGSFGIFVAKKSNIFSVMTCLESFSNRPPSVLTGCRVIIFLKETDIASDVGGADLLADRLDRVGSVGQQREGTFRAVAV